MDRDQRREQTQLTFPFAEEIKDKHRAGGTQYLCGIHFLAVLRKRTHCTKLMVGLNDFRALF